MQYSIRRGASDLVKWRGSLEFTRSLNTRLTAVGKDAGGRNRGAAPDMDTMLNEAADRRGMAFKGEC